MYGLPQDLDPHMFVGRAIESLTFAENLLLLQFASGLSITVLNEIEYELANGRGEINRIPISDSAIMTFVGRTVSECQSREDRALRFQVEEIGWFEIRDDSEQYESFMINGEGIEYVV